MSCSYQNAPSDRKGVVYRRLLHSLLSLAQETPGAICQRRKSQKGIGGSTHFCHGREKPVVPGSQSGNLQWFVACDEESNLSCLSFTSLCANERTLVMRLKCRPAFFGTRNFRRLFGTRRFFLHAKFLGDKNGNRVSALMLQRFCHIFRLRYHSGHEGD